MNYTVMLDGKRICGAPMPSPHQFGEVMVQAIASGDIEPRDCPLDHYFAGGLYGRRIYCEPGTVVTTQRHKTQHITVVLKGRCIVYGGETTKRIEAPDVWITEPGTQRVVYCETETEWLTVHANPDDITDLEILEPILADDTLADIKGRLLAANTPELIL
jgi:hypothetical protein